MMPGRRQRRLLGTAAYVAIGLIILFLRLMPLNPGVPGWPGPDLMLGLSSAWVLRRPDQLPALIIVALALIGDLMLGRPFGLWSFFLLLGTETLRPRAFRWADQPFLFEWMRVAVLMGLLIIGYRMTMQIFMVPVAQFGPVMLQWLATVAAYPVIVGVIRTLGIRRLSRTELDMMGR